MLKQIITLLQLCFAVTLAVSAQDKKVAVFDPAGDVSSSIKDIVREEVSAALVNIAGYTVLERSLISKVLEENKFQTSGLVDDSQISEMGMRMGANYVFVISISSLGVSNYYISCKMIEVTTARIDKQKTARTILGSNEIVDVVRRLMREMFSSETSSAAQSTSVQPKSPLEIFKKPTQNEVSTGVLTTNGKIIYLNQKIVWKNEVRRLMTNTEGLHFYEKGLSQRRWGNVLLWIGAGSVTIGSIIISSVALYNSLETEVFSDTDDAHHSKASSSDSNFGTFLVVAGVGEIAGGVVLKVYSKKNIRKSVSLYNSRNQSSQVIYQFGTTPHGIGMVINF